MVINSYRDRRLDSGMRIVARQLKVLEFEIVDVPDRRVQFHPGQRPRLSRQLFFRLVHMILVQMQVAECVDELPRFQIADLRDHHSEQRIAGDVNGTPRKTSALRW